MRKPADEILDWTVSDKPFAEEAEGPPPETAAPPQPARAGFRWPRWAVPRRVALTTALAAAAVLLAVWAGAAWQDYQLKQEIQALVDAETFDTTTYTFNSPPLGFQLPLPLLTEPLTSGVVQTITRLGPNSVHVEVRRTFVDNVTRREVNFLHTQFYAHTEAGWKLQPPPADFWGAEVLERTLTQRLTLRYHAVDTEFVQALAPTLEKILASACAEWQCPPVSFTVQWVDGAENARDNLAARFSSFSSNSYGSRTLGLSAGRTFIWAGPEQITLPSPHAAGLPADAASTKLYADTVSIMLLRQLAISLSLSQNSDVALDSGNAFRIALVARMAARLGLENPRTLEMLNPNPSSWDSNVWRSGSGGGPSTKDLHNALIITNRLLHNQPITTETKLLKAFVQADGVLSWMVDGLGITTKEAVELSKTVNTQPWPIEKLAADAGEILLECDDGLQVWRANQEAPEPLLTGYFPQSWAGPFSPDGQKLALQLSGQLAVIDFSTGTLIWPPNANETTTDLQWLDNETIAYKAWGQSAGVRFYQLYVGEETPLGADIFSFQLSPDRTQALITRTNGQSSIVTLANGEEHAIMAGDWPQWSPQGEAISYMAMTGEGLELKLTHLEKDISRTLVEEKHITGQVAEISSKVIIHQWSPNGEWLTFNLFTYHDAYHTWVGLVRRDGEDLRMLVNDMPSPLALQTTRSGFSADGRYFALATPDELLLHDVAQNTTRRIAVPGLRPSTSAWSPIGYELLVSTSKGIQRLRDARQTFASLETLTGPECYGAAWVKPPQP